MEKGLKKILDRLLSGKGVYFYFLDLVLSKIVIFSGGHIIEASLSNSGNIYKRSRNFNYSIRKFDKIDSIYKFSCGFVEISDPDEIILAIEKYGKEISALLKQEKESYLSTFKKISTSKKILFIIKGCGIQETVEKAFISHCHASGIELTVLYRYGEQWGIKQDYTGFFRELRDNFNTVKFILNEDFDDNLIDSMCDDDTVIFSLDYDYRGRFENVNLIASSSVSDEPIGGRYKHVFSLFNSRSIGYSSNVFLYPETKVFHRFNPQNTRLFDDLSILKPAGNIIISGGMSWSRDFSRLSVLGLEKRGIIISDELHEIGEFIPTGQITAYHGFLASFALSDFFVHTPKAEYSNDDRHKMIATSICAGKPVIVPYNDGLIVKEISENGLGLVYDISDDHDFEEKVSLLSDLDRLIEYQRNCLEYSRKNMDIDDYMDFILNKVFDNADKNKLS